MTPTHAYLGIKDGMCYYVIVDLGNDNTAKDVAQRIRHGCTIERVPIDVAREALYEAWPRV